MIAIREELQSLSQQGKPLAEDRDAFNLNQSARLNLASLARLFDDNLPRKGGINDHQLLNILRNHLTSDDYDALKHKPAKEVVELAKQYIQDYQGMILMKDSIVR